MVVSEFNLESGQTQVVIPRGDNIIVNKISVNPTLQGNEPILNGLNFRNTKYKVTTVDANVPLDGSEDAVESLLINNEKYKIGKPLDEEEIDDAIGAELITTTITNGTVTGDDVVVGTASVTIVPNEYMSLPNSVTVKNASYSYNSSTGIINLSDATNAVEI